MFFTRVRSPLRRQCGSTSSSGSSLEFWRSSRGTGALRQRPRGSLGRSEGFSGNRVGLLRRRSRLSTVLQGHSDVLINQNGFAVNNTEYCFWDNEMKSVWSELEQVLSVFTVSTHVPTHYWHLTNHTRLLLLFLSCFFLCAFSYFTSVFQILTRRLFKVCNFFCTCSQFLWALGTRLLFLGHHQFIWKVKVALEK